MDPSIVGFKTINILDSLTHFYCLALPCHVKSAVVNSLHDVDADDATLIGIHCLRHENLY